MLENMSAASAIVFTGLVHHFSGSVGEEAKNENAFSAIADGLAKPAPPLIELDNQLSVLANPFSDSELWPCEEATT